ncbi:MAG TPA: hypothetical protein VHW44_27175 [Pseudonocardiaceae bacterium]|nr:hypothetical protein [Pseudonocardiaceae bacterium]
MTRRCVINYQTGGLIWEIVFVAVSVYIARSKGRSGLLWGILGFFFSLITLIVLLLLPRTAAAPPRY